MSALFVSQKNYAYIKYECSIILKGGREILYNSVAIIGGDKRQLFCAKAFCDDGVNVALGGFDKIKSDCEIKVLSPVEAGAKSELIVLPLPCVKGGYLNAPMSEENIAFDETFLSAIKGKKIFCGQKDKLLEIAPSINKELVYDYSQREEFAVLNAVSTAEGALEIAMREFEGTISHSKCLVCGFGRIGKVLTDMLIALNANVTVSARSKKDLAYISTKQCKGVFTNDLHTLKPFDLIFNTVPALIFNSKVLSHIAKHAIVIDLASAPGGVDFLSASRMSICAIHALSLPGKCAPKSAGEIIKNTITNMLEEDDRCQK